MAKLARKAIRHFLDGAWGKGEAEWYWLGKDNDDLSVELNPDTEVTKNVQGETSVKDNGYEPSMENDPFYANPDDSIYPHLRDIALGRLVGDDCKTKILEVIVEDDAATNHLAYTENVVVKPTSYGGDTSGAQIPFTISFDGGRTKGYVSLTGKTPSFTKGEIPSTQSLFSGKSRNEDKAL